MTCFVSHTTFDAHDPFALAGFYRQTLRYVDHPDAANTPGAREVIICCPSTGHTLLFLRNDDPKRGKNRTHLDLRSRELSLDDELARLLALGATVVADRRGNVAHRGGWVVLADPEGNEFCLLPGSLPPTPVVRPL